MDPISNTDEYNRAARRTEHDPSKYADISFRFGAREAQMLHHVLGLGTEAGEVQDAFKRHIFYGTPLDRVNIIEECGDVLWYLSGLLDAVDSNMAEAMTKNIAKLRSRFPGKFNNEAAQVRDLPAERAVLEEDYDSGSSK